MLLIRPVRWGQQKPPAGATLAGGHPLAAGLRVLFPLSGLSLGAPQDLASALRWKVTTGAAAPLIRSSPWGEALAFSSSQSETVYDDTRFVVPTQAVTVALVLCCHNSANTAGAFRLFNSSTTGNDAFNLYCPFSGSLYWDFGGVTNGLTRLQWTPAAGWFGGWHVVVVTAGPAGMAIYNDGVAQVTSSTAVTRDAAASPGMEWGRGPGATTADNDYALWALWDRQLTPTAVAAFSAAPYALLAPPAPRLRYWVLVSTGASGSGGLVIRHPLLSGSGTTTITGTGALAIRHPALSAAGTTTVTGTGAFTVRHPALSASGTTTVTGTGALTVHHPLLSGTGAFVNATGALTVRHPLLSATGTTTVTGTSALSISHPTLAASGAQGPTATAALTIRHPALSASGTTTVTGTATLTVRHPLLAATGTTTVTGTSSLTISHPTLLGASPGTVTGSGALSTRHPALTATGTTTVTGTGSLTIRHPLLAGTAPATVTGAGALAIRHPVLAAFGTLTVVAVGTLTIRHPLLAGSDQAQRDITVVIGAGTAGWAVGAGATGWAVGRGQT